MIINNNLTALSALNITKATDAMIQKSIQPLATGLRINSSADDASGLAIRFAVTTWPFAMFRTE